MAPALAGPTAATVRLALLPGFTATATGWLVIIGPEVSERAALVEVALPSALVTTTL